MSAGLLILALAWICRPQKVDRHSFGPLGTLATHPYHPRLELWDGRAVSLMNAFSQSGQDKSGRGAEVVLRSQGNLGQLEELPETQRLLQSRPLISCGCVCDLVLNMPHLELNKATESGVQLQKNLSQLADRINFCRLIVSSDYLFSTSGWSAWEVVILFFPLFTATPCLKIQLHSVTKYAEHSHDKWACDKGRDYHPANSCQGVKITSPKH